MALLVAVLLLCILAAPARAADRVLTHVDAVTPLSAYGSGLLWSQRGPDGTFRLMYAETGRAPAPLPGIAPRSVPFDADLGPAGGRGGFVAVYSRCAVEPPWEQFASAPPDYTEGRGCRLVEYDLIRRRERLLALHGAGEVLPAVWKDRLAYVRLHGTTPVLHVQRRAGGPSRTLPGGPTRTAFDHPTGIDLYGTRLATAWLFKGAYLAPGSEIRLVDTARRTSRVVDRYPGGGLTSISRIAPAFEHGQLYSARACFGDGGGCPGRMGLVRYRYATRTTAIAPIRDGDVWQARGGATTWILRDSDGFRACRNPARPATPTCTIVATAPRYR